MQEKCRDENFRDERLMQQVKILARKCVLIDKNLGRTVSKILQNLVQRLTTLEKYEKFLQTLNQSSSSSSVGDGNNADDDELFYQNSTRKESDKNFVASDHYHNHHHNHQNQQQSQQPAAANQYNHNYLARNTTAISKQQQQQQQRNFDTDNLSLKIATSIEAAEQQSQQQKQDYPQQNSHQMPQHQHQHHHYHHQQQNSISSGNSINLLGCGHGYGHVTSTNNVPTIAPSSSSSTATALASASASTTTVTSNNSNSSNNSSSNCLPIGNQNSTIFSSDDIHFIGIMEICNDPELLAQQLTNIELERLSHIGPEEFVQAFAKDNHLESFNDMKKTRNLESYIQWFNRLSYLTATEIVKHSKKKQRVRVIEFWIETDRECFNNGNFNSLMAIIAGLNLSPISRLKKTGSNLSDPNSHKSYRPLTVLMFNLEYNYFNLKVFHMKLINLILHCLNTLLIYKILIKRSSINILTAALFACHPVHVEAVCSLVGRADLMFCLCFLLSISLLDGITDIATSSNYSKIHLRLILISILSIIGILFKETAITILPMCIFYELIKREYCRKKSIPMQILRSLCQFRIIAMFILTLIILYFRLWMQNFEQPKFKPMDNPIAANDSFRIRFLSQNFIYSLNIWILLCPQWLCFDWALGCIELIHSLMDKRMLAVIFMYSFSIAIILLRQNHLIFLGFGIFIITFLPASGILLKVGFVIAERILYVPSIGFCLIVSDSFANLMKKSTTSLKIILNAIFILIIILFLLRTRQRATDWMTEERLFTSALDVCPQNAKVHYNIALLAADKGDREKALRHYHKAIQLYPKYESAIMNLANVYRDKGDLILAEKYLKEALNILEEFPTAWMNLGIVYATQKNYQKALECYRKALLYRRNYPICYYNMGNLYLDWGNHPEAINHWRKALELNSKQPKAWANLLTLLDNQGLYKDADKLSEEALKTLPDDTTIMFIRANICGKLERYSEAEKLFKKIISIEPLNAIYHTNLGVLYHRWGKSDDAIESYKNAIKLNPQAKTANENLRKLLSKKLKISN